MPNMCRLIRDAAASGMSATDALAHAQDVLQRAHDATRMAGVKDRLRATARDAMRTGRPAKDAIRDAFDAWSPEAREAAAKARREHSQGTPVHVNAPGVAGHGEHGVVNNRPEAAGGRHFVRTSGGETHGPFHAHQLRATGSAPSNTVTKREEHVPTGTGRSIPRSKVNRTTKSLLGWK